MARILQSFICNGAMTAAQAIQIIITKTTIVAMTKGHDYEN